MMVSQLRLSLGLRLETMGLGLGLVAMVLVLVVNVWVLVLVLKHGVLNPSLVCSVCGEQVYLHVGLSDNCV